MKWIVLLLVVGGLVLASGPALAQGNQPTPLQTLCFQELAKYLDLVRTYNDLAEANATSGGPPVPGARALLRQILAQGRTVAACKAAVAAQANVQSGGHTPPPAQ